MKIGEIESRHILTRSKLGAEYCVNPYIGCQHACVYCYARFMKRFSGHEEPWGEFVDAKGNAVEVFEKDFRKVKPGERAFFGSVTDAYQPLEARCKITRGILEKIAEEPEKCFGVSILTKSDLVLRDVDVLKRIPGAEVGFSVALADERARRILEPRCSPIRQRFRALEALRGEGIGTYAFIGPILPGISDLAAIFASLEGNVAYVYGETLNTGCGNMPGILRAVTMYDRTLRPDFDRDVRTRETWDAVEEMFYALAEKHGVRVAGFFRHDA